MRKPFKKARKQTLGETSSREEGKTQNPKNTGFLKGVCFCSPFPCSHAHAHVLGLFDWSDSFLFQGHGETVIVERGIFLRFSGFPCRGRWMGIRRWGVRSIWPLEDDCRVRESTWPLGAVVRTVSAISPHVIGNCRCPAFVTVADGICLVSLSLLKEAKRPYDLWEDRDVCLSWPYTWHTLMSWSKIMLDDEVGAAAVGVNSRCIFSEEADARAESSAPTNERKLNELGIVSLKL